MLKGKKITVGVTGGIAAYKAADIVSWLNQQGAEVRVAMTAAAARIITPLTMKALSGRAVATDVMSEDDAFHVPHIDIAACDLFVVVPATANIMAKAAHGLADDLLSAALLATRAPVLCAPAMHTDMFNNPATQDNIAALARRGWTMIAPGYGHLACGAEGRGRLAEAETIKQAIIAALQPEQSLAGRKVLVTAGPTYEYIDPVRFIGNRSSGKMGYAVAEAAQEAGARVTLILGPAPLPDLPGAETIRVTSAREMFDAVWNCYAEQEIVVMAAAVADYRPESVAEQKIKKDGARTLRLVRTADILASLGEDKGSRLLIGFAAETEQLAAYASQKLRDKHLDLIIANDVSQAGAGFDGDTNIITAVYTTPEGEASEQWPLLSKQEAGRRIVALMAKIRARRLNNQ